jgi:hypothetical protein
VFYYRKDLCVRHVGQVTDRSWGMYDEWGFYINKEEWEWQKRRVYGDELPCIDIIMFRWRVNAKAKEQEA